MGLEAYRVERYSRSNDALESNVAFVDRQRSEVFVGEVFSDETRRSSGQGFRSESDLRNIESSLRGVYGLPVKVSLGGRSRGPLQSLSISVGQADDAFVSVPGFVSEDGSAVLVGEFHSLSGGPRAFRMRLLKETQAVRPVEGSFYVTAFLDFQCERCRVRAPEVKRFVSAREGAVEARFLPLSKVHDWAFAAAESAAALANVSPALYLKFEEAVFAHVNGMTAGRVRQLALDVAEAAGVRSLFEADLADGRARERVLRDIRLAMRSGIVNMPAFLLDGILVSGHGYLVEDLVGSRRSPAKSGRKARAVH